MVQGGSKRKAAIAADKDGEKSWCSYESVLDIRAPDPLDLPEPPVNQYLEEVRLGMRGWAGDPITQIRFNTPAIGRTQSLHRALASSCAGKACRALLWLAMSGVFGHLPKELLGPFRDILGENWHLLTLALTEEVGGDRRFQDWVSAALPFILAQAIYRMLCDGFAEDRKIFVSHADKLVCKLTQVVHYELTGFQMTADTIRKERRRLLQKHIVKHPNTNQHEFIRGQRRQEKLESQNTHVGDQPLRFGEEDAHPLEETQLDHVMQGMLESRNSFRPRKDSGSFSQVTTGVPPELSVDRYAHLSELGAELLENQLEEFAEILGDQDDDEEDDVETMASGDMLSAPGTPMLGMTPQASMTHTYSMSQRTPGGGSSSLLALPPGALEGNGSRRPSVSFGMSPSDDEASDAGISPASASPSPKSTRKSLNSGRSGRNNSVMAVAAVAKFNMKAQSRDRKAREEKARKLRQEHLLRKICTDKLPEELSEREISTTWVSPCQRSLVKAQDRNCLNKPASEAHILKMETRGMLVRPLSMPALRSKERSGGNDMLALPGSGNNSKDEGSQTGAMSSKGVRTGHGRANSTVGAPGMVDGSALPRVPSAGSGLQGSTAARLWATRGETVSLEPPPRLSAKLIMRRLEDQAKASKQMSFAIYMKEYDIFTNMLKKTVDEKRLRDEEDACLRRNDALLSGPPKRRLAPEDLPLKGGARMQARSA